MTENEIERIFRDSRINLIVEGANEVMQSYIFAYGGKQLAEAMLGVRQAVGWDHHESTGQNLGRILRGLKRPGVVRAAAPLGAELYLGVRPAATVIQNIHPSLRSHADRLCRTVREHAHQFKLASRHFGEQIITRQLVQARLADSAMWLHAWAATLSKLDRDVRGRDAAGNGTPDARFDRDRAAALYAMDMAESEIRTCFRALLHNDDASAMQAAAAALAHSEQLPNDHFVIPEASPNARGTGRKIEQNGIKQFPGERAS
jgi:acyl-CoA dehydrogenase family protein 9